MQPINNLQKYATEYSALESAMANCSDTSLQAMMTSRMQTLAQQIAEISSSLMKPIAAPSAPAASSAVSAAASVNTAFATQQSMKKESDSKSQQSGSNKAFDATYGTYKWISDALKEELDMETVGVLGLAFEDPDDDTDYMAPGEKGYRYLKQCQEPKVATYAYSILQHIGKQFADGETEITCALNDTLFGCGGREYTNETITAKLFKSLKINVISLEDNDNKLKFTWVKGNDYLNWWQKGGGDLFRQHIMNNPYKAIWTDEIVKPDFSKVKVIL